MSKVQETAWQLTVKSMKGNTLSYQTEKSRSPPKRRIMDTKKKTPLYFIDN
jgi:hypothetical protein